MANPWRTISRKLQRAFGIVVLFCIARFVAGFAAITLLDRDAVAWGWPLTIIVAVVCAICLGVALALRRAGPARNARTSRV